MPYGRRLRVEPVEVSLPPPPPHSLGPFVVRGVKESGGGGGSSKNEIKAADVASAFFSIVALGGGGKSPARAGNVSSAVSRRTTESRDGGGEGWNGLEGVKLGGEKGDGDKDNTVSCFSKSLCYSCTVVLVV